MRIDSIAWSPVARTICCDDDDTVARLRHRCAMTNPTRAHASAHAVATSSAAPAEPSGVRAQIQSEAAAHPAAPSPRKSASMASAIWIASARIICAAERNTANSAVPPRMAYSSRIMKLPSADRSARHAAYRCALDTTARLPRWFQAQPVSWTAAFSPKSRNLAACRAIYGNRDDAAESCAKVLSMRRCIVAAPSTVIVALFVAPAVLARFAGAAAEKWATIDFRGNLRAGG